MKRETVTALGVVAFGLTLVSFLLRGLGQFLLGPRTATLVAGPVAVAAAIVLGIVLVVGALSWIGLLTVQPADE